jgi:hypothetical protein
VIDGGRTNGQNTRAQHLLEFKTKLSELIGQTIDKHPGDVPWCWEMFCELLTETTVGAVEFSWRRLNEFDDSQPYSEQCRFVNSEHFGNMCALLFKQFCERKKAAQ